MANKANLANSVLFAPLSDSDTELEVYTGDGALFPAAPFYLTLSPKNKWSRKINSEIVLVTAKADDVFTITRAQKGTTAKEFSYGDLAANGIYKEDLDDLQLTIMQAMMPIGFVVTLGVSTNPADLYGFGTWTAIEGRVLVGKASTGTFATLNATGGAETHTLTNAETPVHSFNLSDHGDEGGSTMRTFTGTGGSVSGTWVEQYRPPGGVTGGAGSWSNPSISWGGGGAHNNLQPYIVKYMWQRTA